uniref:Uncharacterized protein n=1 Tax=Fagus sylvatica TaxID=28930 RepID=A0A2N9F6B9_FAGSY
MEAANAAKKLILKENETVRVDVLKLNLCSIKYVRAFVDNFNALDVPLNILINNAGVMFCPFQLSKDGIEMQFATNHLGPVCKFLTKNQDEAGVSIAPLCLINQDKVLMGSCHSIIMFLNPVLLALLQVEYQFQKVSPFQIHPANVWGFLAATCFYCLGLGLKMHIKSRCAILGHVLLISGAFSSVSLVSIFLPRSLGWLPFIIWAILPFMIGRPLLMRVYRWLYQEILKVILQVGNFFGRFMGPTTVQQQYLPE